MKKITGILMGAILTTGTILGVYGNVSAINPIGVDPFEMVQIVASSKSGGSMILKLNEDIPTKGLLEVHVYRIDGPVPDDYESRSPNGYPNREVLLQGNIAQGTVPANNYFGFSYTSTQTLYNLTLHEGMDTTLYFTWRTLSPPTTGPVYEPSEYKTRILDLSGCLSKVGYKEGVACMLAGVKNNVFYYDAWMYGYKVEDEPESPVDEYPGDVYSPEDDENGDGSGVTDGEPADDNPTSDGTASENKTTGNGGSASKEVDAGRESVLNMLADNNAIKKVGLGVSALGLGDDKAELFNGAVKGDKDGTDIEIPPVGVADEDGVGLGGWAWLLWMAILALGAWIFLLAYKRRKNKENDRAVAKIVADTKK